MDALLFTERVVAKIRGEWCTPQDISLTPEEFNLIRKGVVTLEKKLCLRIYTADSGRGYGFGFICGVPLWVTDEVKKINFNY